MSDKQQKRDISMSQIVTHGKNFPHSNLYEIPADIRAYREYMLQWHLDDFFGKVFFMLNMNKVSGDYAEFGCGSTVRSFRLALKHNRIEPANRRLFAFDSFKGLPKPEGVDIHPQWGEGLMAVSVEQFQELLSAEGYKQNDYELIEGFYNKTLNNDTRARIGLERVAFAHVDCDLYSSTAEVLEFVLPLMAHGGVLSFDDWFCFNGDPQKGEQKAFYEIEKKYDSIQFVDLFTFGWHGKSFLVHRKE